MIYPMPVLYNELFALFQDMLQLLTIINNIGEPCNRSKCQSKIITA